jgi:hypothetical protein
LFSEFDNETGSSGKGILGWIAKVISWPLGLFSERRTRRRRTRRRKSPKKNRERTWKRQEGGGIVVPIAWHEHTSIMMHTTNW